MKHEMHVEQSERNVSCTERNNRWPLTFSPVGVARVRTAARSASRENTIQLGSGNHLRFRAVFHCYRRISATDE